MKRLSVFCVLGCWLLMNSQPRAQAPLPIRANTGGFFHQVTLEEGDSTRTRYRQVVSPLEVQTPLLGGTIGLSSAFMYFEQSENDGSTDTWGALDTEISGDWHLGFAQVTGFATVPTGKSRLNGADSTLAGTLYRNDLNFPVRGFGEGLDFGGAITVAHQRAHLGASVGFAYTARGSYEPFESEGTYHPGDEATFAGGLSYSDAAWTVSLDVAGTFLFTDRLDGLVVFQNGKQVVTRGGIFYEARQFSLMLQATEIFRFKDRQLETGRLLFTQDNRNDFRTSGHLTWRPHPTLSIFGSGDTKWIANTQDVDGRVLQPSARLYGYGGGVSFQVGGTEHLDLAVMRYAGWVDDGARDLVGWKVRANVRLLF